MSSRNRAARYAATALTALVALAACEPRDDRYDERYRVLPPVALERSVAYVEAGARRAYVLDLSALGSSPAPAVTARAVPVGAEPALLVRRAARDEALVLGRGVRGDVGRDPEPATLTAVPAAADQPARSYAVESPFNALAQTPDGRFAFVYFRASPTLGQLLANPNEVALVDLEAPPGATNPRRRTVRSFGGVPNDVVFSPRLALPDGPRTLAVVLSDAYVTLIDLDNPERAEITVRLTLPEDPRAIRPAQVLFDTDPPTLYLRGAGSNDVYVLSLLAVPPAERVGGNDYRPTINQLAAGTGPSDMALFGEGAARRLLVLAEGSREARVIDARSNRVTAVPLDAPADRILLFEAGEPGAPMVREPRAFLYSTRGAARAVTLLDLDAIEERGRRNVETLQLGRPVYDALRLPPTAGATPRELVLIQHESGSSEGQLSLLDLVGRTSSPILAEVTLVGAVFGADNQTLWVAPAVGTRVGRIELASFHPTEVRLDAPTVTVLPLAADATGRRRVVAVHDSFGGHVTVLDADAPSRETAVSVRGFLLTDVLARPAQGGGS